MPILPPTAQPQGGGVTVEQQLENLSPEQLEELKQALIQQREEEPEQGIKRILGRGAVSAAQGFGEGALLGLQGRPISELTPPAQEDTTAKDLETFEAKERIKAKIKQEFGGTSGGLQLVNLPGGGFAFVPGGTQKDEAATQAVQKFDETGEPVQLEDVTIKSGGITGKVPKSSQQLTRELSEEQQKILGKGKAESVGKSTTAQRMSLQQIDLIANSARLFAQTHTDAIREGGMGSLGAEMLANASFFFGGEQSERFEETESAEGLKTEIISRLMPTLTQQGDKPGSVRLVQTIFAKLEKTLPGKKTPAKNAKNMFKKTLTNAFNFSRAAHRLGLTNEFIETVPDNKLESFSAKVANVANSLTLAEDEQDALDSLLGKALQPYDDLILERGDRESNLKQRFGLE